MGIEKKLYIVYNPITKEVYSISTIKPSGWTKNNSMIEIDYQETDREKKYLFIENKLMERK